MQNRLDRINEELKRELSAIIRELKDPRVEKMTSVIAADAAKDLKHAKIYISVLGDEEKQQATLKGIQSAAGFVRRELGHRLGLRNVPELHFTVDHSIEYGAKINKMIHDMNIPPQNSTKE